MGRRGPAPKPTALRLLHGDPPDTLNKLEPLPRDGTPTPPDTLSPGGRAVWDYIVPELAHMGLARMPDRDQIAAYVESVARHAEAQKHLTESGVLVRDRDKALRVNPAARVAAAQARNILTWAREFGLTPASRAHLTAGQVAQSAVEDVDSLLA